MITEIHMDGVASYKSKTSLATDKKINLIYGLNGTGKTTLSNFLYHRNEPKYSSCKVIPSGTEDLLVYNQEFIQDTFYEADSLKGIFSLSKENKAAEQKISNSQKKITELDASLSTKQSDKNKVEDDLNQKTKIAIDEVWQIKTEYTGGDRVLEYCLEGLKRPKEKLFDFILSLPKPSEEPKKTIDSLKKEVDALKGEDASSHPKLPKFIFTQHKIETSSLFQQVIAGNEDSIVANLIEKLENSDWVKQGLQYLPKDIGEEGGPCPFCQENTITASLVSNITNYFGETYQDSIAQLETLLKDYRAAITSLPNRETFNSHAFLADFKGEFKSLYGEVQRILEKNERKVASKLKAPRQVQSLDSTKKAFEDINELIEKINFQIEEHNVKIAKKAETLRALKKEFWEIMRWRYDQTISRFNIDKVTVTQKLQNIEKELLDIEKCIKAEQQLIADAQKDTVNIEQSIKQINTGLAELGMEGFYIEKHSENLYRIVRADDPSHAFHTLSEGEKMIISFLYFCELCRGKKSANDTGTKKIVVIDDPISSLSHVYIYNIGQLIKFEFFGSERYEQVFVLTHSLYFFYELTDSNHERRKKSQNLFRMIKNTAGSQILDMKYDEIQNDYQSYWEIVKDQGQPPALVANCMRNIIEYFFNFVKKKNLNNVFQMPELKENKYQAFCRYINRESHSSGHNIFDFKEFDYECFRDALKLVFKVTGFEEHYEQMMKG